MNILLLSNNAPNYFRFFNEVSRRLVKDGHSVICAVDSGYSGDLNFTDSMGVSVYNFADFFARFSDDDVDCYLAKYADFNLSDAILSDYERAEVYGFGVGRDTRYYSRLKAALLCFFEEIISANDIDAILYENVSNAFAFFAWIVGDSCGVGYVGLAASRLPGRFAIVRGPYSEAEQYDCILKEIESESLFVPSEVADWAKEYSAGIDHIAPDYMKYNNLDKTNLLEKYVNVDKLKKLGVALRHVNDRHEYAFQVGNPLLLSFSMVSRSVARKFRLKFIDKFYTKQEVLKSLKEEYLLYPLHYHPESSTSVLSSAYLDEYEVIRNIAFNLPAGVYLYVKDHVSAHGFQAVSFYKGISSLPNVRLISPFEDTKKLIRESLAVITLTSTVGYEALLLGRKVFLYGEVFYKFHPNVILIDNPAKLFEIFKCHLRASAINVDDYNVNFVSAYYLGTYPGILNLFLDQRRTNELVDNIYPYVHEELKRLVSHRFFSEV